MIKADLHTHTLYSHGKNTPLEMYMAARKKGLSVIGFSEHSPRPAGFDYTHEYREQLSRFLPQYIQEVSALKKNASLNDCQALLGLEMDWLTGEDDFIQEAVSAYDYDYILGSVHFLGRWGFDDSSSNWDNASRETCENRYREYFYAWQDMLASGLFQIAAHPDLIKIFSVKEFHAWLQTPAARDIVASCLQTLKNSGMAMEISSAGLRKPCREIYPCPQIMEMAANLNLRISLASDAHSTEDVAADFNLLADYAKSFGFTHQTVFDHGNVMTLSF